MLEGITLFLKIVDVAWFLEKGIVSLGWVVLCHGICLKKDTAVRFLLELTALFVSYSLTCAAAIIFLPTEYMWWCIRIVGCIIPVGYMHHFSPYGRKTNVLLWCSMYAGVCALSAIGGQLSMLIGEFGFKGAPEAAARILISLLLVPLGHYLRQFNFGDFEMLPSSGMALVIAGDISILLLYVVEFFWAQDDYRVMVVLAVAYSCMLAMVLLAVHAMYAICKEQTEIVSLQAEHQRLLAEQETMKMVDSNLEDLRCIRHDLRNQYAYMQILLQEQRYEELGAYFRQVARNLPTPLKFVDCGNSTMNTILNMEISKARQAQIEVTHQLVVPPRLPFADKDLCAVIANLMDNAIEECSRIGRKGQQPVIHLEIYPQKSYLFIQCRNKTDRQGLNRNGWGLRTTKGDEKLHGYGTRIVSKTAEKYNGIAEYKLEEGYFVARVLLDMMEGACYADQNSPV